MRVCVCARPPPRDSPTPTTPKKKHAKKHGQEKKRKGQCTMDGGDVIETLLEAVESLCGSKSGWLWKRGQKRKNWQKRFFSFVRLESIGGTQRSVKLAYRETETTVSFLNFIHLDGHSLLSETSSFSMGSRDEGLAFEIVNPMRTYYLVALCMEDKDAWLTLLRRIKRLLVIIDKQLEERKRGIPTSAEFSTSVQDLLPLMSQRGGGTQVVELTGKLQKLTGMPQRRSTYLPQSGGVGGAGRGGGGGGGGEEDSEVESMLSPTSARPSLDMIVIGCSGLVRDVGKHCSVRVACYHPATSLFLWWEYYASPAEKVSSSGECMWQADFSFDGSFPGYFSG